MLLRLSHIMMFVDKGPAQCIAPHKHLSVQKICCEMNEPTPLFRAVNVFTAESQDTSLTHNVRGSPVLVKLRHRQISQGRTHKKGEISLGS